MPKQNNKENVERMREWIRAPLSLIKDWWGLVPQPLICENLSPEHTHLANCFGEFEKGKHITWQQWLIIKAIEEGYKRISVVSGHGIGKDALLSWLIHWYLFTHENAQIGCTAPTSDQMYDVLWKELMVWNQRLPDGIKNQFEWSTTHYKIKERPETWWARARTARKETPEAFAGLHGEHVFLAGDEASGIVEEVYRTGEGSLTNEDTLVVLVGNGVRLEGYFYDTHNKDKKNWKTFSFSSADSPIVESYFCERIKAKFGEDSDEFRFMVLGLFPKKEGIDSKGWMPLLAESDLKFCSDIGSFKNPSVGIDPSGEGSNLTSIVVRDAFMAKIVLQELTSTPKGIADKALTFGLHYNIPVEKMSVDNFGQGANVGMEIAMSCGERPRAINVGEKAENSERFVNMRAELFWRLREWVLKGGQLVRNPSWKQLLTIRYKRTGTGKIQIMSKIEMKETYGFESPDNADALALSFLGDSESFSGIGIKSRVLSNKEIQEITNVY